MLRFKALCKIKRYLNLYHPAFQRDDINKGNYLPAFFAFLSARFSFNVFFGSFLVSFLASCAFDMLLEFKGLLKVIKNHLYIKERMDFKFSSCTKVHLKTIN